MKRKSSTPPVTMSDWLVTKPYDGATTYDKFYLNLANQVFSYLNDRDSGLRDLFERDLLIETSVALVSYYEDFINELGLWNTFVRKQKELYGWYLPFYDMSEYDEEYLDIEDFAFLTWHILQKGSGRALDPLGPPLLKAGAYCYDLMEPLIDDAPINPFYDEWLEFGEEIEFFPLKNRLQWLAFDSYLFGKEMGSLWGEEVSEALENPSGLKASLPPDKLAYFLQDDYLYTQRSSLCGLTIAEWIAEWKGIEAVRKLGRRVSGFFLYEGREGKYLHFSYLSSRRLFPIREESSNFPVRQMNPGKDVAYFNALEWKGDWWLSGIFLSYPLKPGMLQEMRINQLNQNFYGQTEQGQQLLREMTADMEAGFIEYFGDRLVFFDTEKEMNAALEAQTRWWNEHKTLDAGDRPLSPYHEKIREAYKGRESKTSFHPGRWGVYFEPGEGAAMSPAIPQIVEYLQMENPGAQEMGQLFFSFFRECSPSLARLLAERYSLRNAKHPLVHEPGATEKYFDFFLRYYNPGDFGEVKPNMTLVPEE